MALRIEGGYRAWGAALSTATLAPDGNDGGNTTVVAVFASYCTTSAREGSEVEVYLSGARGPMAQMSSWPNSIYYGATTGLRPLTDGRVNASSSSCTCVERHSFGDLRLPVNETSMHLNLVMKDGPVVTPGEPNTTIWFTGVEVQAVYPPTPTGSAQPLGLFGAGGGLSLWAEHASHKVFRTDHGPTGQPHREGDIHTTVTIPPVMRGAVAAAQIAFRSTEQTTCSLRWQNHQMAHGMDSRDAGGAIGLRGFAVLSINVSRASGTYGRTGMTPDPLIEIPSDAEFRVPAGATLPVLLKLTVDATSPAGPATRGLTVSCGGRMLLKLQLQLMVLGLSLPSVPSVLTHSNIWMGALAKLAPKGTEESSPFSWELARAHYDIVFKGKSYVRTL